MNKLILIAILISGFIQAAAQDTLPKFSVRNPGNNRIIIGWTNTFETVKQISIQRSFDSTRNFKTILTVADPTSPQNGYADTKAPNDHMFYRLYILLDKGVYLFSEAKRPVWDTARKYDQGEPLQAKSPILIGADPNKMNPVINNKPKTEVFIPSRHVFTDKEGYVRVSLPAEEGKKYSLKVFTIDDDFLFELKDINERSFRIDKANFFQAGWFKFELYEDGKPKEKHKFYLPKEF